MGWIRQFTVGAALALTVTGCSTGSDLGDTTTLTPAPPTTTTTVIVTTTSTTFAVSTGSTSTSVSTATTSPVVETSTSTTQPEPTAEDSLSGFFDEAQVLDEAIASAAQIFNNGFNPETGTISPQAVEAISALSAEALFRSIPSGIPRELRTAALVVYADMTSRIASLAGATRSASYDEFVDIAYDCLHNGRNSNARLPKDMERLRMLASIYPPIEFKSPDSIEAGVLAVHQEIIRLMNWGCDSCGGAIYTNPVDVNWKTRIITDPAGDDPDWKLPFTAIYDGESWIIETPAC